jgi:NAD(P)-dependent dehydrogenase (short-subunit alcohol dehydrogenase family)
MKRLEGKVAVVTGGGGRIGAASARRFAREGAQVVIGDLSIAAAQRVADDIGENALPVAFDAGEPDSIAALIASAVDRYGRLDVLMNTAALLDLAFLGQDTNVVDTTVETWDKTMQVNLRGYMVACKHAIPHMRAVGGGSIINTSSNAAIAGDTSRVAYGASKGAIKTMTQYIATQHGRENIRCNTILPGLILDPELERKLGAFAKLNSRHVLLPRHGNADDVAGLAAFFASDDSSFITGQAISCDGGMLSHQPLFADENDLAP